jgi:hypothetical protein
MGGCFSSPAADDEARQRTLEIDRRIDEDYKRLRKEVKILLLGIHPTSLLHLSLFWHVADECLGSGESGKSTVRLQHPPFCSLAREFWGLIMWG